MPKWRGALNSRRNPGSRVKGYLLTGFGVLVWAAIFIGGFVLMNYIKSTEMDAVPGITEMIGDLINKVLLSMVFLTFLALLVFSNIITALNTYFMSDDLQLLASLPVRKDEFFFSRLTETLMESSWMILLFGLPFFLAYGAVNSSPWYYYALQPAVILPFVLVPAGIGVIVTMALVNAFPARRMRDILFLLSVFGAGLLFLLVRLMRPERLVNPEAQETVFQFILTLKQPMNVWLPSYWCTEILYRLAQGKLTGTGFYLVLLMTSGLACELVLTALLPGEPLQGPGGQPGPHFPDQSGAVGGEDSGHSLQGRYATAPDERAPDVSAGHLAVVPGLSACGPGRALHLQLQGPAPGSATSRPVRHPECGQLHEPRPGRICHLRSLRPLCVSHGQPRRPGLLGDKVVSCYPVRIPVDQVPDCHHTLAHHRRVPDHRDRSFPARLAFGLLDQRGYHVLHDIRYCKHGRGTRGNLPAVQF
jgi:hypothetical protein